jgi:CheY-like chemotaxis protein
MLAGILLSPGRVPEDRSDFMPRIQTIARARQILRHLVVKATRLVSASPVGPTHVLVVDDEPPIREFAARVLENAGYRVTTAGDASEAIASVQEHGAPALLLSDLKMPEMDGDALAARLRRSTPDLKVLYLTGYPQTLFDHRGVLWEGEAFLEKPCSPAELRQAVSLLLFDHLAPLGGEWSQRAAIRSLLAGLAKNPSRDFV